MELHATRLRGELPLSLYTGSSGFPRRPQPVEKLSVAAWGPRFRFKNAYFGALKRDLKPLEPVYAAMNVLGSSFSTG
jgi:hypothetical protein